MIVECEDRETRRDIAMPALHHHAAGRCCNLDVRLELRMTRPVTTRLYLANITSCISFSFSFQGKRAISHKGRPIRFGHIPGQTRGGPGMSSQGG
ncbi:hypothetical protein RRG08_033286 [Elysia crispata]|uniref:Uncharacterized protein n=1 Tax=Elysia crispata TaxID=231223 RepID=A0AAE0XSI4_9GAST|nr:hypothetical protein RRG08_033286 [Elysia crispata]